MCGICGVYRHARDEPVSPEGLEAMKDMLRHRGPDQEGTHLEPFVGLGHRRLSIIGVADGRQPLSNEAGTVWISFNGEIVNYRELREGLIARGHRFATRTDTEAIVHLYEEEGPAWVERLRGMFAIAIWDRERRRLLLARDRLGKKPLYYRSDGRQILFASELKAILAYPGVERAPDLEALHHYLSLAYVPAPRTAFRGIRALPAGSLLEVTPEGAGEPRPYWDVSFEPRTGPAEAFEEELDQAFDEAVRIRLESEVPLGVFLSGGIDSSAVAHRMTRHLERPLVSTTIRFADPRFDESRDAEAVARLLGTEHHVHDVGPESAEVIAAILWHFDEPFADASAIPTYFLSKTARESITVALSGDGGDEMFAGYERYAELERQERLRRALPSLLRSALRPLARLYPLHARGRALLESLTLTPAEAAAGAAMHLGPRHKRRLYSGELARFLEERLDTGALLEALHDRCSSPDAVSRAQYADYRSYLADDILVKVDRMSMAHSLEVRSPLLDHRLVERVASFPRALKLEGGETKRVFKRVLSRSLPAEVLGRPKRGFTPPLSAWFRGELKEFLAALLFDGRLERRGYFSKVYLGALWKRCQRGLGSTTDLSTHVWILAMLELWHRLYIDGSDFLTPPRTARRAAASDVAAARAR
ncbi:MAG: asparagine synthase (glutamine-hydrolyzing) [Planctomycetes bacterium]|nr:asparagine synthase (glutamine-hydrolyzing) [Planctomycetota bacterium]